MRWLPQQWSLINPPQDQHMRWSPQQWLPSTAIASTVIISTAIVNQPPPPPPDQHMRWLPQQQSSQQWSPQQQSSLNSDCLNSDCLNSDRLNSDRRSTPPLQISTFESLIYWYRTLITYFKLNFFCRIVKKKVTYEIGIMYQTMNEERQNTSSFRLHIQPKKRHTTYLLY